MGIKRKRNLKVDNTTNYAVCILRELDTEYLEDYVEVHDSGMEAEEEKEIQLQKIIKDQNGSIPLPIIKRIENPVRKLYTEIPLKKRIKWYGDSKNEYIENLNTVVELMSEVRKYDVNKYKEQIASNRKESEGRQTGNPVSDQGKNHNGGLDGNEENTQIIDNSGNAESTPSSLGILVLENNLEDGGIPTFNNSECSRNTAINHSLSTPSAVESHGDPSTQCIDAIPRSIINASAGGLWIFVNEIEILKNAFATLGESSGSIGNKHPRLVEFVLNRALLRYEKNDFGPYICFRRRIFHPTFKSRRNEAAMLEKLERMSNEFNSLKILCDLLSDKCAMEMEYLAETSSILRTFHSLKLNKKQRKTYRKKILCIPEDDSLVQMTFNIHSIMTNRNKIAMLRNVKHTPELFMDPKFSNGVLSLSAERPLPPQDEPGKKICRRCSSGCVFYRDDDALPNN